VGVWTYQVSLVVPDGDEARFLLLLDGAGWRLPQFTLNAFFIHLYHLPRQIHDQLGADMVVLQSLIQRRNEATKVMDALVLMDNRTPNWTAPEGARWVNRAELEGVVLAEEWMRPTLVTTFDKLSEAPAANRPAWFERGWFAQVEAWISDVLVSTGYRLLRPPEQFKQGAISAVVRTETTSGAMYLKVAVALPLFGNEPQLTMALGQLYPDLIQEPLAIDAEKRWMLTADIGTELRESKPPPEMMEQVIKKLARLQIASAGQIDTLFAVGCLDRRIDVLAGQIDALLTDEDCVRSFNADERATWQGSGDALKELCQQLKGYAIPNTLVHGDFHAGNIALDGEHIRFFDWTDACVTHPFFDLSVLVDLDGTGQGEALRDAYLAEWSAYEAPERLQEAFAIGYILGALHQVVSYSGIVKGIAADQRTDWEDGAPFWARRVMQLIKI
jgi:hypothetical protein